jgi:hypothetical protein
MRREALYMVPHQLGINDRFDARGPRDESMRPLRQYTNDTQTRQGRHVYLRAEKGPHVAMDVKPRRVLCFERANSRKSKSVKISELTADRSISFSPHVP